MHNSDVVSRESVPSLCRLLEKVVGIRERKSDVFCACSQYRIRLKVEATHIVHSIDIAFVCGFLEMLSCFLVISPYVAIPVK